MFSEIAKYEIRQIPTLDRQNLFSLAAARNSSTSSWSLKSKAMTTPSLTHVSDLKTARTSRVG